MVKEDCPPARYLQFEPKALKKRNFLLMQKLNKSWAGREISFKKRNKMLFFKLEG